MGPGEFIGRSDLASMCLDDPRVSEAHAMVSLRGQSLKLLALRGRFRVGGKVRAEITLRAGMSLELAQGLEIECVSISLPRALLGLQSEGLPVMMLMGTMTLHLEHTPRVTPGYDATGDVVFWAVGAQWRASIQGAAPRGISIGDTLEIDGTHLEIVAVPLEDAAHTRTRRTLRTPLCFRSLGDAVRIEREDAPDLLISGIPGKICAALVDDGPTLNWRDVTSRVWPNDASMEAALRRRFDAGLARLRSKLEQVSALQEEFIELDGAGMISLKLTEQDQMERSRDLA